MTAPIRWARKAVVVVVIVGTAAACATAPVASNDRACVPRPDAADGVGLQGDNRPLADHCSDRREHERQEREMLAMLQFFAFVLQIAVEVATEGRAQTIRQVEVRR